MLPVVEHAQEGEVVEIHSFHRKHLRLRIPDRTNGKVQEQTL